MTTQRTPLLRRRRLMKTGVAAAFALAGCVNLGSDDAGPQELSFTLTLTRSDGSLDLQIEPPPAVEDVIRIHVGDSVEFTIRNDTDDPIGFHNHANDAEVVIEPGADRTMAFEATEAMVGRQAIEGWVAQQDHGTGGNHTHDGESTTLAIIEVRPRGS